MDGGGGLIIAPGDQTDPIAWNALYDDGNGLLPAGFGAILSEEDVAMPPVSLVNDSLLVPWLLMFRHDSHEGGFDLTDVRFSKWWDLSVPENAAGPVDAAGNPINTVKANAAAAGQPAAPAKPQTARDATGDSVAEDPELRLPAQVVARLSTGAPYIVSRGYGRGRVIQLAGPLDDLWSTLPGRRALAPLLHEFVFYLAGHKSGRNVDSGAPLLIEMTSDDLAKDFHFIGPEEREFEVESAGDELHPAFRMADSSLAGIYQLRKRSDPGWEPQSFVVNFDRTESDLSPLKEEDLVRLQEGDRLTVISTVAEIREQYLSEAPKQEIWYLFLVGVLCFMILETYLTRRLVQGGHESVTPALA